MKGYYYFQCDVYIIRVCRGQLLTPLASDCQFFFTLPVISSCLIITQHNGRLYILAITSLFCVGFIAGSWKPLNSLTCLNLLRPLLSPLSWPRQFSLLETNLVLPSFVSAFCHLYSFLLHLSYYSFCLLVQVVQILMTVHTVSGIYESCLHMLERLS